MLPNSSNHQQGQPPIEGEDVYYEDLYYYDDKFEVRMKYRPTAVPFEKKT